MADSLIDLIKLLRDRTGAGLMDCKGALLACDSDLDKATDWLREKGLAKAAKKADRIAAEGLTLVKTCDCCGKTIILEVNCETDFVAKGDPFKEFCDSIATTLLKNSAKTLDEAKTLTSELFAEATVKMGEKFDLRRFVIFDKVDGQYVNTYIHMGGKISVVAVLDTDDVELGKGIAMHIAANNPQYLSRNDIDAETLEHETSVQLETAKGDPKLAGKPEEMVKKIIEGKVNKYFSEMILGDQVFLMDGEKKVAQVLAEKKANVLKFVRYQVGEGIEKRKDNFAEEVAAQVK